MTRTAAGPRRLSVVRVCHSAVVGAWRRREAALADESVAVTLIAPGRWNEGGSMVDLEISPGEDIIEVPTIGRHPFRFVFCPWSLWKALREHRHVDVLDIHEEPAALATIETVVLARIAGCRAPVVAYSAQNLLKRYPPPFRWFEHWVLQRVAAVHTCNDDVAEVLAAKGFRGEVVNLGLGVDEHLFVPTGRRDGEGRDRPLVGFVGRFTEQKGIFVLVSALALVDEVDAVFVGAGPDEAKLRAAIEAHGLADRVRVDGFVAHADLPATYRSLDVLVVPSIDQSNVREQFGRVIIEAMACGTPVIVSDVGAFPAVAADAAIVFPDRDVQALAGAIQRLRDSPDERAELRTRGLRRAGEFSWRHIATRHGALYRRVTTS